MGRCDEARDHLAAATTMYREMGMTYGLEKAEAKVKSPGMRTMMLATLDPVILVGPLTGRNQAADRD